MLWTVPSECVQEGKGHLVGWHLHSLPPGHQGGWLALGTPWLLWQVEWLWLWLNTCSRATCRSQLPCAHLPFAPSSSYILWFHSVMTLTSG